MVVGGRELIDTLWNVNVNSATFAPDPPWINRYIMECKWQYQNHRKVQQIELIDTLWNVNQIKYAALFVQSRINRYIMECKLGTTVDKIGNVKAELIDTLWNVNKDGCEYVAVDFTN